MTVPHYVLEVHYVGVAPQTHTVTAPRIVIGRDGGDLVLADPEASSTHAELEFDHGNLVVRDLGSSNGTWKGSRSLPQFALSAGESFRCGNTVIHVRHIDGPKHRRSGGTVLGSGAQVPRGAALADPTAGAGSPPTANKSPNVGLIVAIAALGVLVFGSAGTLIYLVWFHGVEQDSLAVADEEMGAAAAEDDAGVDPHQAPAVEPDLGALYRDVGAATVVIRVPGSVGSGAIIDPSGLIITNHHLIAAGKRDGLKIKAEVTLGQFNPELGAYEPRATDLEAFVVKVDVDHDLALLRLVRPPDDLPSLKLAGKAPYPGQRVAALGHAGVGMLWAIKGGEVSSTGSLAGHTALALDKSEGDKRQHLSLLKKQIEKQGRVVQSTARILPGDSGGPLVNMRREIVAINAFGRIDRVSGQWVSFHVHLAEVEPFVASIPDGPLDFIPDPWNRPADTEIALADADLDGVNETLKTSSATDKNDSAFFLDLDQDSAPLTSDAPKWAELNTGADGKFEAEFVAISVEGKRHFLYDTDNDGRFDVYMVDSKGVGQVSEAYRVDHSGRAQPDTASLNATGLAPKLFKDLGVRKRFRKVAAAIFPRVAGANEEPIPPDPVGPSTQEVTGFDYDRDDRAETFVEERSFQTRIMFDLDQTNATAATLPEQLRRRTTDLEAVFLAQLSTLWAWYDTDADGRLDLLLSTHNAAAGIAQHAWTVDRSGHPRPTSGHIGRRLVRSDLFAGNSARRLAAAGTQLFGSHAVATDPGLGSFPSVAVSPTAVVVMNDPPGHRGVVALVTQDEHDFTLIDVDNSSLTPKHTAAAAAQLVRRGGFDPEFVLATVAGSRWAYYDSDGVDGFDVILIATEPGSFKPDIGYRISAQGAEEITPGTSLVAWGRFSQPQLRSSFEVLANKMYPGQSAER